MESNLNLNFELNCFQFKAVGRIKDANFTGSWNDLVWNKAVLRIKMMVLCSRNQIYNQGFCSREHCFNARWAWSWLVERQANLRQHCWPESQSKDAGQTGLNCTMVFFPFIFVSLSLSLILLQGQSLASSPDGGKRGVTRQFRKRVMTGSWLHIRWLSLILFLLQSHASHKDRTLQSVGLAVYYWHDKMLWVL